MSQLFGSVRVRLTAAVAIIFGVALSIAAFGLVREVQAALMRDVQVRNDAVSQALVQQLMSSGRVPAQVFEESATTFANELGSGSNIQMIQEGLDQSYIYATGAVGSVSNSDSFFDRLRKNATGQATPLFGKLLPSQVTPDKFEITQATVDIPGQGRLVLNVASPLEGIRATVEKVAEALLVAVPTLVVLVGAMTWFMTGRVLRPVSAITGRVQDITGSTLHERVPEPHTDDEIAELARTMNAMLDRIEGASEHQKRFMSDASHELRSPVAAIKTQLETALLDPETDWDTVAKTVLNEDERLESLVVNLLALARLEEGQRPHAVEVDLDEVVHEQTARPVRVPIDRSGVLAGRVLGVRTELTSVVRNLFDNAARHASTQVRVRLATHGPTVRLEVDDDGPGIEAADRSKVFERFARLEEGRSRDAGGSGLGLALTRRAVEAHGGNVFVETSSLGGASFVVELPSIADEP
jgi:signal transduction histidine kinase